MSEQEQPPQRELPGPRPLPAGRKGAGPARTRGAAGAVTRGGRTRGADARSAVRAAGSGAAPWGEHGSLPRGGGCVLRPALAHEAARGALLRQGSGPGRPPRRCQGREGGFGECAAVSAPAPPVTSALRWRGALSPSRAAGAAPGRAGLGLPSLQEGAMSRSARRGGGGAQGARRERAGRAARGPGAAAGPARPGRVCQSGSVLSVRLLSGVKLP